jgi:hypothetical protein
MTAAYFEDHPTDPEKVILRKPSHSTDCPNCEYHRKRAQHWRDEAYKQAGHPLPERDWVGLTDEEMLTLEETTTCTKDESWLRNLTQAIEAKLKEKNGL